MLGARCGIVLVPLVLRRRVSTAAIVLAHPGVERGVRLPVLDHGAAPLAANEAERDDGLTILLHDVGQVLREMPAGGAELWWWGDDGRY